MVSGSPLTMISGLPLTMNKRLTADDDERLTADDDDTIDNGKPLTVAKEDVDYSVSCMR